MHQVSIDGREFAVHRNPRKCADVQVSEHGTVVLRLTCNPDAPLSDLEGVLKEYVEDDALPTPEEAKSWGPAEEELWHPSMGKSRPDGSIELAVTVSFETYVTDHGVHRFIESSWWTETDEDLGFEEGGSEDHESLPDQVICFLGNELTEGQRYVLLLNIDGRGQSQTHFCYSRKHWPPVDL